MVTGTEGNLLNEVELPSDSLMMNNGILHASNVIKLVPKQSIVGLEFGVPIKLSVRSLKSPRRHFFCRDLA
jgi:hypothetical protein